MNKGGFKMLKELEIKQLIRDFKNSLLFDKLSSKEQIKIKAKIDILEVILKNKLCDKNEIILKNKREEINEM